MQAASQGGVRHGARGKAVWCFVHGATSFGKIYGFFYAISPVNGNLARTMAHIYFCSMVDL
jgi:hypothetical protein